MVKEALNQANRRLSVLFKKALKGYHLQTRADASKIVLSDGSYAQLKHELFDGYASLLGEDPEFFKVNNSLLKVIRDPGYVGGDDDDDVGYLLVGSTPMVPLRYQTSWVYKFSYGRKPLWLSFTLGVVFRNSHHDLSEPYAGVFPIWADGGANGGSDSWNLLDFYVEVGASDLYHALLEGVQDPILKSKVKQLVSALVRDHRAFDKGVPEESVPGMGGFVLVYKQGEVFYHPEGGYGGPTDLHVPMYPALGVAISSVSPSRVPPPWRGM